MAAACFPKSMGQTLRFPHKSGIQISVLAELRRIWRSLHGVKAEEGCRPIRARRVLQECLADSFRPMHQARCNVLLCAVQALIVGRRLTMMDVARGWPGAERVRAPLKAFDRLLGKPPFTRGASVAVCRCGALVAAQRATDHRDRLVGFESGSAIVPFTRSGSRGRTHVAIYGRRMQIELSFRDLKSHRYGDGLEDSLTRSGKRLAVLLLVHVLANFASWLAGLACRATGMDHWLTPVRSKRKCYSTMRIGQEALARSWPMEPTCRWLQRLRSLPPDVLVQARVTG